MGEKKEASFKEPKRRWGWKRMLASCAALALILGLCGCGRAAGEPESEQAAQEQAAQEQTAQEQTAGEPAVKEPETENSGELEAESPGEQEETVFTVNGEAVGLREWNFYIRMNQMQWEKEYLDAYGDDMWTQTVDEDGTTLADALEDEVFEIVCRIHLMNQYAKEYAAELTDGEQQEIRERAESFMEAYNEALLEFAGADEDFVYERLCEKELSLKVEEACVASWEPELSEEEVHREGICYVLISTSGTRDEEGNLTPYSHEEVERRTAAAYELCENARASGDLKSEAEAIGLTPIEADMGNTNDHDGKEHRMLDAARELAVGEISDPVETEEGWFLVQHTSDYDEEGTEYWREYLTELAREEKCEELYSEWQENADIQIYQENMDLVNVKIVLKELL